MGEVLAPRCAFSSPTAGRAGFKYPWVGLKYRKCLDLDYRWFSHSEENPWPVSSKREMTKSSAEGKPEGSSAPMYKALRRGKHRGLGCRLLSALSFAKCKAIVCLNWHKVGAIPLLPQRKAENMTEKSGLPSPCDR